MKRFNGFLIFCHCSSKKAQRPQLLKNDYRSLCRMKAPDAVALTSCKQLQTELIEVISKYIHVDQDLIKVQLERNGDHSVLELNVTLPPTSNLVPAE